MYLLFKDNAWAIVTGIDQHAMTCLIFQITPDQMPRDMLTSTDLKNLNDAWNTLDKDTAIFQIQGMRTCQFMLVSH